MEMRHPKLRTYPKARPRAPMRPGMAPAVGLKVVVDPYNPAHRLLVNVNLNDPLEWCMANGKINTAQYQAGNRFRWIYEQAEVGGGVPALDYSRPKVDGGYQGDPLPIAMVDAANQLAAVNMHLGQSPASFLRVLIGLGRSIASVAEEYALAYEMPLREASASVRFAFRHALADLAKFWKIDEARGPARSPIRAARGVPLSPGELDILDELETFDMREKA